MFNNIKHEQKKTFFKSWELSVEQINISLDRPGSVMTSSTADDHDTNEWMCALNGLTSPFLDVGHPCFLVLPAWLFVFYFDSCTQQIIPSFWRDWNTLFLLYWMLSRNCVLSRAFEGRSHLLLHFMLPLNTKFLWHLCWLRWLLIRSTLHIRRWISNRFNIWLSNNAKKKKFM